MMDWRRLLSAQRLGHKGAEAVTAARSPFQKDWDRVVFSSAFRRLQDKTQVHSLPESDYVRTRLTHSLEVSSVGRSLGAAVGQTIVQRHLGEGALSAAEFGHIVAAACLAHDIGNPPFGHFGEHTIRHWFADPAGGAPLIEPLSAAERGDLLGFDGNAQGFRVIARLQNWRDAGGLRLTCATLATFTKYPYGSPRQGKAGGGAGAGGKFGFFQAEAGLFREVAEEVGLLALPGAGGPAWCRHPLACLLEAADDICYRVVDLEDGYKIGRIGFEEAEELLGRLVGTFPPRYREIEEPPRRVAYLRAKAIGQLIDDVAEVFLDREADIVAGRMRGELLAETAAAPALAEIDALTRARIFETRERFLTEVAGGEILTELLAAFSEAFLEREQSAGGPLSPRSAALIRLFPDPPPPDAPRAAWLLQVTDFVSGMTDTYALTQFRRLKGLLRD
jgi:dGTPase